MVSKNCKRQSWKAKVNLKRKVNFKRKIKRKGKGKVNWKRNWKRKRDWKRKGKIDWKRKREGKGKRERNGRVKAKIKIKKNFRNCCIWRNFNSSIRFSWNKRNRKKLIDWSASINRRSKWRFCGDCWEKRKSVEKDNYEKTCTKVGFSCQI